MSDFALNDWLQDIEQRLSPLERAVSQLPTRPPTAPPSLTGNAIYAQVVANVASGDPTGLFENAVALDGTIPAGGTGTFQNQYGQVYTAGDWAILHQRKDNSQWLTELAGGTSGSQVVGFGLTEAMGYADIAKLAKPLLADGTLNSAATAFYVVDFRALATSGAFGQFYGTLGYTDADSGAVVWDEYRGEAVKFTDDWNSTGIPGYRIVTMEGPADFWIGTCAESLSGSPLAAKATYDATIDPSGSPFSGRRPPLLADSRVTVYDDLNLDPQPGEKWVIKWDKIEEHYVYWRKIPPDTGGGGVLVMTDTDVTVASYSAPTFTPGDGVGYLFVSNEDGTWDLDTGTAYDLYNSDPNDAVDEDTIVQCKIIDGYLFVDVEPCDA
jgi:hypothetical protein